MAELYQLDFGYKVRVVDGRNAGQEGFIVMGSRLGDVGISTYKRIKPKYGCYQIREDPSNLEILSNDDKHGIKQQAGGNSCFDSARLYLAMNYPQVVFDYPEFFSENMRKLAKSSLVMLELKLEAAGSEHKPL